MGKKTRVYFATDLHGSSKCFRKFVNAGQVYGADVLILGGDLAGKALQTIVRQPGGRWTCEFIGSRYDVEDGPRCPPPRYPLGPFCRALISAWPARQA